MVIAMTTFDPLHRPSSATFSSREAVASDLVRPRDKLRASDTPPLAYFDFSRSAEVAVRYRDYDGFR